MKKLSFCCAIILSIILTGCGVTMSDFIRPIIKLDMSNSAEVGPNAYEQYGYINFPGVIESDISVDDVYLSVKDQFTIETPQERSAGANHSLGKEMMMKQSLEYRYEALPSVSYSMAKRITASDDRDGTVIIDVIVEKEGNGSVIKYILRSNKSPENTKVYYRYLTESLAENAKGQRKNWSNE